MTKRWCFIVLLISLITSQLIISAEADFDVGEKIDKVFSWFGKAWKKTKTEVNGVLNKITRKSSATQAPASDLRPSTVKPIYIPTTTTAKPKEQQESGIANICGQTRYTSTVYSSARQSVHYLRKRAGREVVGDGEVRAVKMRISGGRQAKQNEAPWHVRLVVNNEEMCGATVLNNRTIITAAHCAEVNDVSKYKLYVADHTLSAVDMGEKVLTVSKVIRHPQYDSAGSWANDLALLITSSEIPMVQKSNYDGDGSDDSSWRIRPICLPPHGSFQGELAGLGATISGFGHIDSNENAFSPVLKVANVRVMNHYVCKSHYRGIKPITPAEMICAGFDNGDVFVDACQGDSGGGMTSVRFGRHTLLGVTSFGLDCDNKDKIPGVYARVTTALSWIQAHAVGPLYYAD